jgi:peptide/nickel transport system substrate-binding protein
MRKSNGVRAAATVAAAATLLATVGSGPISASASPASVSSFDSYVYGKLPTQHGTPTTGGTVTIAEPPGTSPTFIFPITPSANQSVYNDYDFQNFMWRTLYWGPKGFAPTYDYAQSMAGPPKFSNDNKTATITLKPGWKWSDGQPVTSQDLAFYYWLLKAAVKISPANYGNYTPGLFPDNTTISTPNPSTFVVNFAKSYNQNFDLFAQLDVLQPLPAHAWAKTSATGSIVPFDNMANATAIYNFLIAQSKDPSTYGSNPLWQVVDGPYKIQSFDPATGANTLVVNPNYSGPVKPHISTIQELAFTSTQAEFNQFLTGNLDAGFVSIANIPEIPQLEAKGYTVFGYPDFGFSYLPYNFKDKTGSFNKIIGQLYMRQVLAHLQDQPAEIKSKGVFDGAGSQSYGAVPAAPVSPFTPASATVDPYPFSIATAKQMLTAHGWNVVPNGTTTCARPGGGAKDCGAGIAKGTPLSWNLFYANENPLTQAVVESWVSNLSQVGIKVKLVAKTFNFILENYDDPAAPKNDSAWAMEDFGGFTIALYPTTNEIFNTEGSFNIGGFNNPQLDADIHNSQYSTDNSALQKELKLVEHLQPALFQPNEDRLYAFKNTLSGPPSSFEDATQLQYSPEYWYFTK